jgi:selenium-binding protein 1
LGQLWVIYPLRKDANGNQGVIEELFDLGPKARDTIAI